MLKLFWFELYFNDVSLNKQLQKTICFAMNEIEENKILQEVLYFIPVDVVNIIDKFLVYIDFEECNKKLVLLKEKYEQDVVSIYDNLIDKFIKKLESPHCVTKQDTIDYIKNIFKLFYGDCVKNGKTNHSNIHEYYEILMDYRFKKVFDGTITKLMRFIIDLNLPYFYNLFCCEGCRCCLMMIKH